jgi:hypothetical protein
MQVQFESFDIKRVASIYPDNAGTRWWTKAWFNDREVGEPAIEISRRLAVAFINGDYSRDEWLTRFYPKQMSACRESVSHVFQQKLNV